MAIGLNYPMCRISVIDVNFEINNTSMSELHLIATFFGQADLITITEQGITLLQRHTFKCEFKGITYQIITL